MFRFALLSVVAFFIFSCSEKSNEDWIVKIDTLLVSPQEFSNRMNFNPYLRDVHSDKFAKEIVLSSLVAEKLLFLEAQKAHFSDSLANMQIRQNLRETLIEQIRIDSVENKIQISQQEMIAEFRKSIKEVELQFVAFRDDNQLKMTRNEIKNGTGWHKAVSDYMQRMGWHSEIPYKKVKWDEENYDFENQIFALKTGDIKVLSAHGEKYLVNTLAVNQVAPNTANEFRARRNAIESRLRSYKIARRYTTFYDHHLRPLLGDPEWRHIHRLVDLVVKHINFSDDNLAENQVLNDQLYISAKEDLSNLKSEIAARFPDGSTWTIGNFFQRLQIGPYAFNFKSDTLFRRSFARNTELLFEHQALLQYAKSKGYTNNKTVKKEHQIWESYIQGNAYRYDLLKRAEKNLSPDTSKKALASFRLDTFEDWLCAAFPKHDIKINRQAYNTIHVNLENVVVKKSHFANRLMAPPLEPLFGLDKWENLISQLIDRNNLN